MNKEVVVPDYELGSVDFSSNCLIDSMLSPYFDSKLRQHCFAEKAETDHSADAGKSRSTSSPYSHFSSEDSCLIPRSGKNSWLGIIIEALAQTRKMRFHPQSYQPSFQVHRHPDPHLPTQVTQPDPPQGRYNSPVRPDRMRVFRALKLPNHAQNHSAGEPPVYHL